MWENFPDNACANFHHEKLSLNDIVKWISEKHHDFFLENELRMMICENKTQNVVGAIDLFNLNKKNKTCGMGIIVDQKHRRKGFAEESIQLMSLYCFHNFLIKIICCTIHPDNKTSIQLFEKCGFVYKKINEQKLLIFELLNLE